MLKTVLTALAGIGILSVVASVALATADELPVIGDERAVTQRFTQAAAAALPAADLVRHGEMLFRAKFTVLDGAGRPLATQAEVPTKRAAGETPAFFRTSGPEANACDGCHNQPATGGAGEFVANVFTSEGVNDAEFDTLDRQFSNERGTPPVHGSGLVELLAREMTADLQALRDTGIKTARETGESQNIALASKGVSFGSLIAHPTGFIDIKQIAGVDFDLVVRPFSQKGVFTSLRQFTINALNAHHGIQASERYGEQWTDTTDFDGDGYADELDAGDVTALVVYQASRVTPVKQAPDHPHLKAAAMRGEQAFGTLGCESCHRAYLPLKTVQFTEPGPYNNAGNLRLSDRTAVADIALSTAGLKQDENGAWMVPVFSDLKRHRIADDAHPYFANELLGQRYIPRDVFITAKLWSVGNTAPYGHRGDITTLREAILHHGGEANQSRANFEAATPDSQADVIEFLKSLQIIDRGT